MTLADTRTDPLRPTRAFAELDARTHRHRRRARRRGVRRPRLALERRHPGAPRRGRGRARPPRTSSRRSASPAGNGLRVTPQATGHGPMAELVARAARHHQGPRRVRRPPRGLGARRSRREVAPRRRGGRPLRAGAAVRVDHRRRRRRLHHRRRPRADGPHLRPGHRQGARHRGRHRRRRPAARHPDRAPGPVLRAARRQGDAGHRHRDRVRPGAPADVLRRLAVVRRRATPRPSSSGGCTGPRTCPSSAPPPSRCSSCRRCRACRRSSPTGSRCRCATSGPATPRRGSDGSPRSAGRRRSCSTTWRYKPYTAIDSVHTDPLDPTPAYEAAAVLTDFPPRPSTPCSP